jgi:hypothetical protein
VAFTGPVIEDVSFAGTRVTVVSWTGGATGDTGTAYSDPGGGDRSVQIEGTFGGSTVNIHGSNNGTEYHLLTDPQGNDLAKTAADLEQITEQVRHIRPNCTGGAGSAIAVTLVIRRQ